MIAKLHDGQTVYWSATPEFMAKMQSHPALIQADQFAKDYYAKLDAILHDAIVKEVGDGVDIESLRGRLRCISTRDLSSYYLDETHLVTVHKLTFEASKWRR